jgi:hypothetical protein
MVRADLPKLFPTHLTHPPQTAALELHTVACTCTHAAWLTDGCGASVVTDLSGIFLSCVLTCVPLCERFPVRKNSALWLIPARCMPCWWKCQSVCVLLRYGPCLTNRACSCFYDMAHSLQIVLRGKRALLCVAFFTGAANMPLEMAPRRHS